jgi:hypothetical protein
VRFSLPRKFERRSAATSRTGAGARTANREAAKSAEKIPSRTFWPFSPAQIMQASEGRVARRVTAKPVNKKDVPFLRTIKDGQPFLKNCKGPTTSGLDLDSQTGMSALHSEADGACED